MGAEQSLEQAALTLSDQAAQAQDFTLPDLDADAAQRRASQARRREQHPVLGMKLVGEGRFGRFLPGHQPDRLILRDGLGIGDRHQRAVPQYRHTIAEADDFIPAVRDEEDDRARVAQARNALGEPRDFVVAERRSRFVEQEHAGIALNGAHDLQHLPPAERQIAEDRARIDVQAMARKNLFRRLPRTGARDAAPGANRRGGEQEVALDAQLTHQGQFLEHARDALADRVIGVAQSELLAVESDGSVIRNNRAADDLDQGRFAGAVFSSEAKDGSARRLKRDRFQRAGRAEGLFDPRQGQHGLARSDFTNLDERG